MDNITYKENYVLINDNCLSGFETIGSNTVDSIVTDPPYGLSKEPDIVEVLTHWLNGDDYQHAGGGFMGKTWDSFVPGPAYWRECYRVLKPGGYLLAFCSTRTWDLLSMALRIAGFENRDTFRLNGPPALGWTYATGFPKSMDIAKALTERQDETAQDWEGWGTALKPAWEVILVFRKPVINTIIGNVQAHGTGALNLDACRVARKESTQRQNRAANSYISGEIGQEQERGEAYQTGSNKGGFPSNWLMIHSYDCNPDSCGTHCPIWNLEGQKKGASEYFQTFTVDPEIDFIFIPKPTTKERNLGCDALPVQIRNRVNSGGLENDPKFAPVESRNIHPTVKPIALMSYLVQLVTRPGGVVLDPFAGSGTTGMAAVAGGFYFIGMEMSADYFPITAARLEYADLYPERIPQHKAAPVVQAQRFNTINYGPPSVQEPLFLVSKDAQYVRFLEYGKSETL
jgi:DNA modification methylase